MSGRFGGRVALVTGGARGMGAAHCAAFAAEGASVVVADRRIDEACDLAERLGEGALAVELEVADEDGWARVVETTCRRFGGVDVLVNNAGVGATAPLVETSLALYRSPPLPGEDGHAPVAEVAVVGHEGQLAVGHLGVSRLVAQLAGGLHQVVHAPAGTLREQPAVVLSGYRPPSSMLPSRTKSFAPPGSAKPSASSSSSTT